MFYFGMRGGNAVEGGLLFHLAKKDCGINEKDNAFALTPFMTLRLRYYDMHFRK